MYTMKMNNKFNFMDDVKYYVGKDESKKHVAKAKDLMEDPPILNYIDRNYYILFDSIAYCGIDEHNRPLFICQAVEENDYIVRDIHGVAHCVPDVIIYSVDIDKEKMDFYEFIYQGIAYDPNLSDNENFRRFENHRMINRTHINRMATAYQIMDYYIEKGREDFIYKIKLITNNSNGGKNVNYDDINKLTPIIQKDGLCQ